MLTCIVSVSSATKPLTELAERNKGKYVNIIGLGLFFTSVIHFRI